MNAIPNKLAEDKLLAGFKIASDVVRLTYGPNGKNAIIERDIPPFHEVCNDAQTIVQSLHADDPYEKIGLGLVKELMTKADSSSGDGRKTTLLIADSILTQGFASDMDRNRLRDELNALIPVVEAKIDQQKVVITENEVEGVASIAGESKRLGKLIGDIYKKIGKDGIIHVEGSGTYNDDIRYIEGVRFMQTGFLSPFMVHDEQAVKDGRSETQAVYENPVILVTKRKISHVNDINPLLSTLSTHADYRGRPLVIFTDDMDSTVASYLVTAHKEKRFKVLIIKAPILWKQYVFEDFAKITGATIVEDASGVNFKNLALSHLGTCGKIIVDKEETTITGIADISSHLQELKAKGDDDSKLRLSWLTTKTAILKLGANNESELSYLRLKCADAINSARLALKDGVVEGAGVSLLKVAEDIDNQVLSIALQEPYMAIRESGGFPAENVVDASLVVKNAVRNAVSLASTILTLGVVIRTPEPSETDLRMMELQAKQRPY